MTTQNTKNITLAGVVLGWEEPVDNRPGKMRLETDDGPVMLNIWPDNVGILQKLDMSRIEGAHIQALARYSDTRNGEIRYRPSKITLLDAMPEGAPPTPKSAPKAPPRSAPTGDTQRDSIERQVAAKGAIELLATKAITPDEFDQWFDHILDRIQGREPVNNEPTTQEDEPPVSSVQRL